MVQHLYVRRCVNWYARRWGPSGPIQVPKVMRPTWWVYNLVNWLADLIGFADCIWGRHMSTGDNYLKVTKSEFIYMHHQLSFRILLSCSLFKSMDLLSLHLRSWFRFLPWPQQIANFCQDFFRKYPKSKLVDLKFERQHIVWLYFISLLHFSVSFFPMRVLT